MAVSFSQDVLNPLVRGTNLERTEARDALAQILEGKIEAPLIASFLTALTAKGETADEMTGFVDAMIASATTFSVDSSAMDIVGTGGDQLHTVNISTMASLAVAGSGVKIAKHGNRAASSSVGSADVLEALGVRLDAPAEISPRTGIPDSNPTSPWISHCVQCSWATRKSSSRFQSANRCFAESDHGADGCGSWCTRNRICCAGPF